MFKSLKYIVLLTFLLILRSSQDKLPVSDVPSIVELLENFGKEFMSVVRFKNPSRHVGELARISESLIDKSMFLGLITAEMTEIIHGNVDLEELKEHVVRKFQEVNSKLNSVFKKLDSIKSVISGELIEFKFEENVQKIVNVKEMMAAFEDVPNDINRIQTLHSCEQNRPRDVISFLKSEVVIGGDGSLFSKLKNGRNLSKLLYYMGALLALFNEAIFRYEQCLAIKYGDEKKTEDEVKNLLAHEKGTFKTYLKAMEEIFQKEIKNFEKNTIDWAKQDTIETMQGYPDLGHAEFAENLLNLLKGKYPNKKWVVISVEANIEDEWEYLFHLSQNGFLVKNQHSRSLAVFTTQEKNPNFSIADHVKKGLKFGNHDRQYEGIIPDWKKPCQDIYRLVHQKDNSLNIVCVDKRKGHASRHSQDADFGHFFVGYYNYLINQGEFILYDSKQHCEEINRKPPKDNCLEFVIYVAK